MKVYSELAPYYDRFMSHIDYEGEAEAIYGFLFQIRRVNGRVLDIGAGSGGHMLPLIDMDVKAEGLDYSEEMIAVLREKLRRRHAVSRLYTMDMRAIETERRWDVIYCFGETIHHLGGIDDAAAFFRSAAEALRPGGYLVFSWQAPDYFDELAAIGDFYEEHGDDYLLWSVREAEDGEKALYLDYTAFIREEDGRFGRVRETHRLAILPEKPLYRAAGKAGFSRREDYEDLCFGELLDGGARRVTVLEKI